MSNTPRGVRTIGEQLLRENRALIVTNQNKDDLLKLRDFISSLNSVKKVELLPYHSMGAYKWKKLGQKYELENVRQATDEDIKKAKEILGIS